MNRTKINKVISICLVVIFTMLAVSAEKLIESAVQAAEFQGVANAEILFEDESLRERDTKYFVMSDGTGLARIYPSDVHYEKEGEWKEIDNTLEIAVSNGQEVLRTKEGAIRVELGREANGRSRVIQDDYVLEWKLRSVFSGRRAAVENPSAQAVKIESANKSISEATYTNIKTNTDLNYLITGNGVKESIIVKSRQSAYEYIFDLTMEGLTGSVNMLGEVVFTNDEGEEVFVITAPYMEDANGVYSTDVSWSLDGNVLKLTADKDWMNAEERAYPVVIDPTVQTSATSGVAYDTFAKGNEPVMWYQSASYITVSNSGYRGLIKFNLPSGFTRGDRIITKAMLNMTPESTSGTVNGAFIKAAKITSGFNSNYLNNSITIGETLDLAKYNAVGETMNWDITGAVNEWYSTGINNGLALFGYYNSGTINLHSSESSAANAMKPFIEIEYVIHQGLEDNYPLYEIDLGADGQVFINTFTGQLTYKNDVIVSQGNNAPINVSAVYDSISKNTASCPAAYDYFAYGWRLTNKQYIQQSGSQYLYVDEDWTKHYFSATETANEYENIDGYDMKLKINQTIDNKTYSIIEYGDGTKKYFGVSLMGILHLSKIEYENGTYINYPGYSRGTMTSSSGKSATVTMAAPAGSAMQTISTVADYSGRVTTFDNIPFGRMNGIIYPDASSTSFLYDADGNMTRITCADGRRIDLAYTTGSPVRVASITEHGSDGTRGQKLAFEYGVMSTKILEKKLNGSSDATGKTLTVSYDRLGRIISTADEMGRTQFYGYSSANIGSGYSLSSNVQRDVNNLLKPGIANWSAISAISEASIGKLRNSSIKMGPNNTATQTISVTPGKTYIFSSYISTENAVSGQGSAIGIRRSGNSTLYTDRVTGTSGFVDKYLVYTVPAGITSLTLELSSYVLSSNGYTYFSDIQFVQSDCLTDINLLQNNTFDISTTSIWSTSDYSFAAGDGRNGSGAYKTNGVIGTGLHQSIPMIGSKGDEFTAGIWVKGIVPDTQGLTLYMSAYGPNPNGSGYTSIDIGTVEIHSYDDEWKYICVSGTAELDYTRVSFGVRLKSFFPLPLCFDDAQLFRSSLGLTVPDETAAAPEEDGSTADETEDLNKYDQHGNVTLSVIGDGTLHIPTSYTYSNFDFMTSETDSRGNTISYSYDTTKGLLLNVTDAKGTVTNYTYDAYDKLTRTYAEADGKTYNNYYSYDNGFLSSIKMNNSFGYAFDYDEFGNITDVGWLSGSTKNNLVSYDYLANNGGLSAINYANGQSVGYTYDSQYRQSGQKQNGTLRFTWEYNDDGNVVKHKDLLLDLEYTYSYDRKAT